MSEIIATTKVEYDENGQLSVLIPKDFLDSLDLVDGETLQWCRENSETIVIKRLKIIS